MEVTTYGTPNCQHTMTTDHFILQPEEAVAIPLEIGDCGEYDFLAFYGYRTTRTKSRQFTVKDKIRLAIVESGGLIAASDGGFLMTTEQLGRPVLHAENLNKKKELRIRLRAKVVRG